ncbi:unnamed protein product [Orchesella dallaii]|uniref:Sushi domain-containing protein n=1 Tax=Orchesella dallaii TaxID=48710 RepID=A0ABP1PQD4_9HEXA
MTSINQKAIAQPPSSSVLLISRVFFSHHPLLFLLFHLFISVSSATSSLANGSNYLNLLRSSDFSAMPRPRLGSLLGSANANEVPRLPVWNNAPDDNGPHIDFTQLFEMMGEPRGSQGRAMSELISRPKPKCNRRIRILNGVTRIRERGSIARFQCSHGFMLIGPTTIVCLRDRWSEQPPICVRGGCRTLQTPVHGIIRQSIGGAVAQFQCLGNSQIIGEPLLYCDGAKWNGSEPICYVEPTTTVKNYDTSTEEEEIWPESAMTPAATSQETGAEWDTNLEPVISTTTIEIMTSGNQLETFFTTSESPKVVINVSNATETPIKVTTIVYPTQNEITTKVPVQPSHGEIKTQVPAQPTVGESVHSVISTTTPKQIYFRTEKTITNDEQLPDARMLDNNSTNNLNVPVTTPPTPRLPTTNLTTILRLPTIVPSKIIPVTPPRRVKIPKRTRRPIPTRNPYKRPTRPRKQKFPKDTTKSYQKQTYPPVIATTEMETNNVVPVYAGPDTALTPLDYPIAIDKEMSPEHVAPIRPITPDMLNINQDGSESNQQHSKLAHASMVGGVTLFIIGLTTFSAGVLLYCWRKNKGIARARPYDMDGRTLSAHDANDDFTWMEQRDSGL